VAHEHKWILAHTYHDLADKLHVQWACECGAFKETEED
jgi:hypothetical protein